MKEKGIISIVVFLFILTLSIALIVGGSIYIKYKQPQILKNITKSNNTHSETENKPNLVQTSDNKSLFKDKIVFINPKDNKIYISSTGIKNIKSFNEQLFPDSNVTKLIVGSVYVSPENNRMLVGILPNAIMNLKNLSDYQKEANDAYSKIDYYLTSLDGNIIKKVKLESLRNKFEDKKFFIFQGWSKDGKKLVFVASSEVIDVITGNKGSYYQIVGEYDPETDETKELFSLKSRLVGYFFYDSQKHIIAYTDGVGLQDYKSYIRDLKNNTTQELNRSKIGNNYGFLITKGEYFVNSEEQLGQSLKIYSIYDSSKLVSEVKLTEDRARYQINAIWSPSLLHFAVLVEYDQSGYGIPYRYPSLYIYERNGKLVSKTEFTSEIPPSQDLTNEFETGSIFSNDENKFLYVSKLSTKSDVYYWRIIDVKTGKIIQEKLVNPELGKPIIWF